METTMERKRMLFHAGKIPAPKPTCRVEHRGPLTYDRGHTEWMNRLASDLGMPQIAGDYVQCQHCFSHIRLPKGRRAE